MLKSLTANQNPPDFKELKQVADYIFVECVYNKQNIIIHWSGC